MGGVLSKGLNINTELNEDKNISFNENESQEIKNVNKYDDSKSNSELNKEQILSDNNNTIKNEELNDDSSVTNFSSNKLCFENFNNKLFSEKVYNNIDEEEVGKEDKIQKNQDKELTKNIKSVFIDSKIPKIDQNISNSERSTLSLTYNSNSFSSLSEDYELNIFRSGKQIRESYLEKLITKNIWKPNFQEKIYNSIIIFDWDDTLLPTSFLSPGGNFNLDITLSICDREKLLKIEREVYNLLNNAISKGDVYIITNADNGWVELSSNKFYPSLKDILQKIKNISAREEFGKILPGDMKQWKIQSFLNLLKSTKVKLVTNLICLGDSYFEIEAGRILGSKFREAFIKTIQFKQIPTLDDLLKQLNKVNQRFNNIYSTIRNMKIKVERKIV